MKRIFLLSPPPNATQPEVRISFVCPAFAPFHGIFAQWRHLSFDPCCHLPTDAAKVRGRHDIVDGLHYSVSADFERLGGALSGVHGQVVLVIGQVLQNPPLHHLVHTSRPEVLQNFDQFWLREFAVATQVVHDLREDGRC